MSLSIGFPNAAGITIGGKSATTIRALGDATADAAAQALGTKKSDGTQVKTGQVGLGESAGAQAESQTGDNTSVAVKVLLKRLKELQQQLREQQQQLAQAQAASYPTPQAKTTAVAAIEGQVADTNGAILQVSASLIKELAKGSGTGSVVNTTA
ncbi:hypothetical protein PS934_04345 [Pseudomonas fluorescens]|uniref:Uncharacterized protein n=1 Tax=Pseudomonas fluorescens TaxID=294 RepID=A0A8H2P3B6_PSEFL|nr:hypothetical protein [Pseudomonas fluorescens]VVP20125.1 hypothetical protein PS900_03806 [Pseudomonas fluorescens]VVQ16351.1 hypothetical protein PS934_04345 [Pseudomonas fluorescens]